MGKSVAEIKNIIASLHEFNPMMGHRGCRLAVTFPEIAAMQTRAVIKAALNVNAKHPDWHIVPEIMIPLVGEVKELKYVKDVVVKTADEIISSVKSDMKYKVGTMIEIPRAALTADEIAKEADFFSFGTNDLTQMTFGFSRDDAGKFLGAYYDKKIYENDPFAKLDQVGVLPQGRSGLCFLLPVPCAHRPSRRRAGCDQGNVILCLDAYKTHNRKPPVIDRRLVFYGSVW